MTRTIGADSAKKRAKWPDRRVFLFYLETLVAAVLIGIFARTFLLQAFHIPTPSMASSLLVGDQILVNKLIYASMTRGEKSPWWLPMRPIRRGDIVLFAYPVDPRHDFVKRCVGLPGDRVEIVDKELFVNGRHVDDYAYTSHRDPRIYRPSRPSGRARSDRDNLSPQQVPDGHYFCLGDNRDGSHDSRTWGPVPAANVRGRGWLVYWSVRPPATRATIETFRDRLVRAFVDVRWNRCLRVVR